MENIIIALIFLAAIAYLVRLVWNNFNPKNTAGCSKGCGSCAALDADKIMAQMENHKTI
ncbi:FeoB-associated Cys-rich membrane protein [Flectobacillus sp. DC10W]|uniref:FeoB-associated Cys-rich membrane protein n=1 Tax=Flectobacillus longus TaxID=2984207 RepID=A0ABT6YJD4_9BACT|nr:FeoB-associated Cys-rich membrane protein [Flectobacillus longus]MDI9863704.1 FeoB-associated Cys-rich membrane protein [Flectobacillus longus]